MNNKKYELGIVIGRFQPLHIGHQRLIDKCIKNCEKTIVLIGSAQKSGTLQNPFNYTTRNQMLYEMYGYDITILPLLDIGIGNGLEWGNYIIETVRFYYGKQPQAIFSGEEAVRQKWFNGNIQEINSNRNDTPISATEMREFLLNDNYKEWCKNTPSKLHKWYEYEKNILKNIQKTLDKSKKV